VGHVRLCNRTSTLATGENRKQKQGGIADSDQRAGVDCIEYRLYLLDRKADCRGIPLAFSRPMFNAA
jgi:hypothetical protein